MKYLVLAIALFLTACGSAGGGSNPSNTLPGNSPSPAAPGEKTWKVRLTGDGVTFTLLMVADQGQADEEQVTVPPTTIPVGVTLEYTVSGNTLNQAGVSRIGAAALDVANGGPWLNLQLLENGGVVGAASLSTSGTFHAFQPR